jgi:membrane protease YdiL (CAAX protease family)
MQTYLKTRPGWIQLLLFVGLSFGVFITLYIIGAFVLYKVTGIGLLEAADLDNLENNPQMIIYLRGLLFIQFLGLFVIPSLLFGYFSDPRPGAYLGFRRPHSASYWILGIGVLLVSLPFVEYIGWLNHKMVLGTETQKWMKTMEEQAAKQIEFMFRKRTPSELFLNLVFISLFAGIGEELFFRGVLQRLFIKITRSPWAGIIITAIIFSAIHLQFFGFFPRFFLGILLGALYWFSGSLWTAMLAHFAYDALIIVLAYFKPELVKDTNATIVNPSQLAVTALVSAALTFLILWQIVKKSKSQYAAVYKNDHPSEDEFSF